MKNRFVRKVISDYLCVAALIVILVVFAISTQGKLFQGDTVTAIVNQVVTTIIGGLGMIFVIAVGGTDITLGGQVVFSAGAAWMLTDALKLSGAAQLAVAFVICLIIGVLRGLFMGVVNTKFKVPSFMISLALMLALRGGANWMLGSKYFRASKEVTMFDSWALKIPILLALIAIMWYIMEYTPFGYKCKAIGENENAIKYAGVNTDKIKIFVFIISGIMASIVVFFMVARNAGVTNTLASGFEMRCMLALFVAGVPVDGGTGTKMFKLIVGAFTVGVLESGLTLMNVPGSYVQLVKGIIMLALIILTVFLINSQAKRKAPAKAVAGAVKEEDK